MKRRMLVIGIIALFLSIGLLVTGGKAASIGTDPSALNPRAGQWYVSIGGSDANDCLSTSTPCSTINGVLSKPLFVAGDSISVTVGIFSATSGTEVVLVDKDVTLSGGWDAAFASQIGQSTIDGSITRRGITIAKGVSVTMDHFVVQNGRVYGGWGGGIYNYGDLTITNCSIQNNRAMSSNGIYNSGWLYMENCAVKSNFQDINGWNGGGIENYYGTVVLNQSSVINNSTEDRGGGIYNYRGTIIVNNTTISGNKSGNGGGIENYGGTVELNQSSVINNSIDGMGGGIFNILAGTLVVNNSTISGNRAGNGGGIHSGYGNPTGATTYLNNTTISHNIGNGVTALGPFIVQNTILAQNFAEDGLTPNNCAGNITSAGYNIFETATDCIFTSGAGDLIDVNPDIMPLFGNPAYYPIAPDSPAIDAGNPDGCKDYQSNPLPVDQRGVSRYGRCDIGAYEYDPAEAPIYCQLPLIYKVYCSVLYSDDFSNPNSGWPIGYDSLSGTLLDYTNGEYQIRLDLPWTSVAARPGFAASDYYVTVDLRKVDNRIGSYGLIFGISSDWTQFYTLEIYPDGWYGIYRYDSDGGEILSEAFSSAIHQGSYSNRLSVKRSGSTIIAYANGVMLASVVDGTYTGNRYLGLVVFAYTQAFVDIRFDNFIVIPIRCGGYGPTPGSGNDGSSSWSVLPGSDNGFTHGFTKHQP